MTAVLHSQSEPFIGDRWGLAKASDRRFRRLVVAVCLYFLAATLWSRLLPPLIQDDPIEQPVTTVVELLLEPVAARPDVSSEPEPVDIIETPPRIPEPQPTPEEIAAEAPLQSVKSQEIVKAPAPPKSEPAAVAPPPKSAREQAQDAGLLAMRQELLALRNASASLSSARGQLRDDADIAQRGLQAPKSDVQAVDAETLRYSAGSNQSKTATVANRVSGSSLSSHVANSEINRQLPSAVSTPRGGSLSSGRTGRSLEEIQLAFDRNKSAFSAIFSRAARTDGSIDSGAIVVSLTISPSGDVIDCRLVSSSFQNPTLHQRILTRVKMLQFEPKDVPPFTYPSYPINYVRS